MNNNWDLDEMVIPGPNELVAMGYTTSTSLDSKVNETKENPVVEEEMGISSDYLAMVEEHFKGAKQYNMMRNMKNWEIKSLADDEYIGKFPVKHNRGIHLRPAIIVGEKCQEYESVIEIANYEECKEKPKNLEFYNAKRVIDVMSTGIQYDQRALIIAEGADAKKAIYDLKELFQNKFGFSH